MDLLTMRNPTWSRDELILALDCYLRWDGNPPSKGSDEIKQLSDILNQLNSDTDQQSETYRNPNGAYMKIMNFRRFDPVYVKQGKVGLSRGGKGEEEVWDYFQSRPGEPRKAALAIIANIGSIESQYSSIDDDPACVEAEEGRILTVIHRRRERSRKLIEQKKQEVLRKTNKLECECCSFDFEATYGERGRGFIEVHHTKPLHTLKAGEKTNLDDLAVVCANCHRKIHSQRPWLEISDLKRLIRR